MMQPLAKLVAVVIVASNGWGAVADPPQAWNVERDFSADENPHRGWSFGWKDSPAKQFTTYDMLWGTQADSPVKGFFAPGWFGPVRAWCNTRADADKMVDALPPPGELYYPDHWVEANFQGDEVKRQAAGLPSYPDPTGFVAKNMSDAAFGSWGYFWEPGMVVLMPPGGRGSEAQAVVRWTSPLAARVEIEANFTGQRIQGDAGMQAEVRVRHNDRNELFGRLNGFVGQQALQRDDAMGPARQQIWHKSIAVEEGDTIDLMAGAPPDFDYGVFGVQNKQVLPGVGLAARITVLPAANELAQSWIAAKFEGQPQAAASGVMDYGASSDTPPFTFTYDGRRFADEWKSWKVHRSTRSLDNQRTEHVLEYIEPRTGLVARCIGVVYNDFPTIEWTLYFENPGPGETPILAEIQPLDLSLKRHGLGEFSMLRIEGSQLLDTELRPQAHRRLVDSFPYFNIGVPGGGLVVGLSWSGQTALELDRDETNGLRLRGGQALTHFKLHAGEEVRTPMIVLQFWSGERVDAQNIWRQWMIAHNMPQPMGKQLGPQWAASGAYQFGNMVLATEENQKHLVDRYLDERLKPDFLWMDAGWYPPNTSSNGTQLWGLTGTWEPDRRRFPRGLRAIADHAHKRGIGVIVWCQPERVSPGTELYLEHSEFLLGADGADKLFDFGNPAGWKWATDRFSQLIADEGIDIYRQDMNISPASFWRANDTSDRQGITEIKHVVGYLAYLDELIKRNPNVRLDHFRVDLETLRRAAPLILGVDYDPVADQCHNYRVATWIPWHGLCSRVIEPYSFRSMMCPAIATGWDVRQHDLDYALARRLIGQWKAIAPTYLGDFYPLTPYTFDDRAWMAWQYDCPDHGEGIVQAFRRRGSEAKSARYRLHGLDPAAHYAVDNIDGGTPSRLSGAELMDEGLPIEIATVSAAVVMVYEKEPASTTQTDNRTTRN